MVLIGGPPVRVAARCVLVVADDIGDVLLQGAAAADRHQLHAAADPQRRDPCRSAASSSATSQASRSRRIRTVCACGCWE